MRLQILLILLVQVALVESLEKIIGYLGDNVTLPSKGNSLGILSTINWSVFPNSTWIATYQNDKPNTDRISRYKGRLRLNISTGDLTISNLSKDDAMEYTVDLINTERKSRVNKFKLKVIEHLKEPTIKTLFSASGELGCWIGLHCISAAEGSEDLHFSWHVNSPSVTTFSMKNSDVKPGDVKPEVHSAFLYKQIPVNITCISSRYMENTTTSVVAPQCDHGKPQIQHQTQCNQRHGLYVVLGIVLGLAIAMIYNFRDYINSVWNNLRGRLCSSNNSPQT